MEQYEVKVLGIDDNIYTVDEFLKSGKTHKEAVGVVFGNDLIGLRVLALESWKGKWGSRKLFTDKKEKTDVLYEPCGFDETRKIISQQSKLSAQMTAIKWCWCYTKGRHQWYMPSIMELVAMRSVYGEINRAMARIGCGNSCMLPDKPSNLFVWSVSETDEEFAWGLKISNNDILSSHKLCEGIVRTIAKLPLPVSSCPAEEDSADDNGGSVPGLTDDELLVILRGRGYTGELTKRIAV